MSLYRGRGKKIMKESNRHVRCCLHYIGIIEDNLELVTFFLLFFILKSTTLIELRHFISRSNQYRWVSLRFTSLWTSRSNSSPNTSHLFVQTHIRAAQGWSRCKKSSLSSFSCQANRKHHSARGHGRQPASARGERPSWTFHTQSSPWLILYTGV